MVGRHSARLRSGACAGALASLFAACQSIEIGYYESDCYRVGGGSVSFSSDGSSWTFSGVCAERKNPACPPITRFVFRAGPDTNGNGQLDSNESVINVDDGDSSDDYCVGAMSGSTQGASAFVYSYEVWKEGQDDKPIVSKSEVKKP